jgi:hypothetical protein
MQDTTASVVNLTWQDTAFFADTLPSAEPEAMQPSLFAGHELISSSPDLRVIPLPDADNWVFLVFMLCAVCYAAALRGGEGRPITVIKAAFDQGLANQLSRNDSGQTSRNLWLLLLMAMTALSMFSAMLLTDHSDTQFGLLPNFLLSFGAITSVALGLWLTSQISGLLFGIPQTIRNMMFDRSIMVTACGMLQLPLLVLYFYGPSEFSTIYIAAGVVILGIFYLKDMQRGVGLLWNQPGVNFAHIFYYICAFKILPLSVVFRLAIAL